MARGELPHFLDVLPTRGEAIAAAEGGRQESGHPALALPRLLPLLLQAANDEVVCLNHFESGQFSRHNYSLRVGSAKRGRVGGLIIAGIVIGLGGDVVLEVGPNGFLIVELIDDFACLLDGLDDELDLVIQVIYLLDLDLYEVVLQNLLAPLRITPDALL
jgi:hypothetical protein